MRKGHLWWVIAICVVFWETFEHTVLDRYVPASSLKLIVLRAAIAAALGLLVRIICVYVIKNRKPSDCNGENGTGTGDKSFLNKSDIS